MEGMPSQASLTFPPELFEEEVRKKSYLMEEDGSQHALSEGLKGQVLGRYLSEYLPRQYIGRCIYADTVSHPYLYIHTHTHTHIPHRLLQHPAPAPAPSTQTLVHTFFSFFSFPGLSLGPLDHPCGPAIRRGEQGCGEGETRRRSP